MKNVVLFDMDGTLTPARKPMENAILRSLCKLQKAGFEIGIVTGSDLNYLEQQCFLLFEINQLRPDLIHFLPCNGTKYYKWDVRWKKIEENDMIKKIGSSNYRNLLSRCLKYQNNIVSREPSLDFTGNFLDYRGSVLNWCPIGRSATHKQREKFVSLDKSKELRKIYLQCLEDDILRKEFENVQIALGGETSFDIYPTGWDKTFALKFFPKANVYFVGDRCQPTGNDFTIYKACGDQGYSTKGPAETALIIEKILGENEKK